MNWLPDPVEFAEEFCKPEYSDYGLPAPEAAWNEAVQYCMDNHHGWSHDAVQASMRLTNRYDISHADPMKKAAYQIVYQKFLKNYEAACNQIMSGQELASGLLEDNSKQKARPVTKTKAQKIESKKIGSSALSNILGDL